MAEQSNLKYPSAAILVIGDEILKGQIQDTNTIFMTKKLKSCGVMVKRVVIIPDNVNEIANEVLNNI